MAILKVDIYHFRILTGNFGKMTFLRYLGKSVRVIAYPCIHISTHCKARQAQVGGFLLLKMSGGFFASKDLHEHYL